MIARVWRSRVRRADLEAYKEYVTGTGIKDYRATPGNRGAYLLSRVEGDEAVVMTVSFWDDLASIRAFAGDDVTRARYYPPDDERFLLEHPERVEHFEVA
jgi:heme-degrading monooxygenase HmoA